MGEWILNRMRMSGIAGSGQEQGKVACSIECREFIEQLRNYDLPTQKYAPLNYVSYVVS
jgi:hypothetical protein